MNDISKLVQKIQTNKTTREHCIYFLEQKGWLQEGHNFREQLKNPNKEIEKLIETYQPAYKKKETKKKMLKLALAAGMGSLAATFLTYDPTTQDNLNYSLSWAAVLLSTISIVHYGSGDSD